MKKIFEWFDDNYLEEKTSIVILVNEACIKHACSIESLYEACLMMRQYNIDKKTSLRREVKYFSKLADHGISGFEAGKKLRSFFDVNHIIQS